jgi:hypothetical protein
MTPRIEAAIRDATPSLTNPNLGLGESFAARAGNTFAMNDGPGYIDYAVVGNFARFRFDAAYDNPFPDRAEFFYGACGVLRGGNFAPDAPGPLPRTRPPCETGVDHQDLSAYLELALNNRFSGFIDVPFRFINPEQNDNARGFGDLRVGFKFALIAEPENYLTFQMKAYTPTGDAGRGLGTDHVSLEPGLLCYSRLSDNCTFFGEIRDWIPIDGTETTDAGNFAGNVLRYGAGLGYDLMRSQCRCESKSVTFLTEFVGWSVLDGYKVDINNTAPLVSPNAPRTVADARTTIVNVKLGIRASVNGRSLYAGYGRALTGQTWYEDIFRLEYRVAF